MESQIKIRATVPEMNMFFEEENGVRYMEIRDRRYSSDEIERMPKRGDLCDDLPIQQSVTFHKLPPFVSVYGIMHQSA